MLGYEEVYLYQIGTSPCLSRCLLSVQPDSLQAFVCAVTKGEDAPEFVVETKLQIWLTFMYGLETETFLVSFRIKACACEKGVMCLLNSSSI